RAVGRARGRRREEDACLLLDEPLGELETPEVGSPAVRRLLDARLGAAPLVAVVDGAQGLLGLLRPAHLAAVVGGLLLGAALLVADPPAPRRVERLERLAAAYLTAHGLRRSRGDAASLADEHRLAALGALQH